MKQWQNQWDNSQRGRFLYYIQPKVKPTFDSNLHSRREESIIHRLRVRSCLLNDTLFKIGKHPNGLCSYCNKAENVQHFILECRQFERERIKLRSRINNTPFSLETLLGPKNQRNILKYVRDTQKFDIL